MYLSGRLHCEETGCSQVGDESISAQRGEVLLLGVVRCDQLCSYLSQCAAQSPNCECQIWSLSPCSEILLLVLTEVN